MDLFSADDRGNVVDFYEKCEGTWEQCARLDRGSGEDANELFWDNWSGEELEKWAFQNGYVDEILGAMTFVEM